MKTRTHLYTFPIENDSDRAAVEGALEKLSTELALTHALRLKGGHRGLITIPDIEPEAPGRRSTASSPTGSNSSCPPLRSRAAPPIGRLVAVSDRSGHHRFVTKRRGS